MTLTQIAAAQIAAMALLSTLIPAQANDECSGALPVGAGVHGPFSTVGATTSAAGFACEDPTAPSGRDVWFRHFANCSGQLRVSTASANTDFDTTLAAFVGSDCVSLTPVGCSLGDAAAARPEHATMVIPVTAGLSYYILVGGSSVATPGSPAVGNFELTLTCAAPPAHDELANAISTSLGPSPVFSTLGATVSPEPIACLSPMATAGDVWHEFFPAQPAAGCMTRRHVISAEASRTDFAAVLTLYSQDIFGGQLTEIFCSLDEPYAYEPTLLLSANPRNRYFIRVSGADLNSAGSYALLASDDPGGVFEVSPGCGAAALNVDVDTVIGGGGLIEMTGHVGAAQALWLGTAAATTPICGTCAFGTDLAAVLAGTQLYVTVPCDPYLIGASFYAQGADLLGVTGGCSLGSLDLTLTETVEIWLGG
ncbi:MAG: hypothetical protein AAF628_34450 [Planctomycetota bacterium]